MTTLASTPCFDQLHTYKTRHSYQREARFEKDLRTLTNQLHKKLDQRTKNLKKMKKLSKKAGRDEMKLTNWKIEMFSPLYPHNSKTQKWMLFRAAYDLWKVMQTNYGKGFSFRIKENTRKPNSNIKHVLYLSWNPNKSKSDLQSQLQEFERPSHLDIDPRDELYQDARIRQLKLQEEQRQKQLLEHQESLRKHQESLQYHRELLKKQHQLRRSRQRSSSRQRSRERENQYGHLPGMIKPHLPESPEQSELGIASHVYNDASSSSVSSSSSLSYPSSYLN